MNRKDEYRSLIEELEDTPVELEYTLTRAQEKVKSRQKHRFLTIPLSSVATFLIIFTILVNFSTTFVYAAGKIPVFKELAQLLAFSPSLSAAIENEYVQPMKLEQMKDDIAARVEFVIVDQKQVDIFYSLDSKVYPSMGVTPEIRGISGKALEGYTLHSGAFQAENRELRHITASFTDKDMPNGMELTLKVEEFDRESLEKSEPVLDQGDYLLEERTERERVYLSEFVFQLKFDPHYTAQGETLILNETFEIDNERLTLTTVDIYPSHIRLNFQDHDENTAWLQSFELFIENEKGKRYQGISNGISATGSPDSPMMASHRLESSFFSNSKKLNLYITGVKWLDKDMEKVLLDLKNQKIEALPQDVRLESIEQIDNSWILEFSGKQYKEDASYQLWSWDYYDEDHNEYHLNGMSSNTNMEMPGRFEERFALKDYPYDKVYLSPSYSRMVKLPDPVKIKVK